MKTKFLILGFCLFGLGFGASPLRAAPVSAPQVLTHYATLVQAGYQDTLQAAKALQTAVERFVAQPSQAHLDAAQNAWLAAREFYGQTEAFRFYGGPIDADDGPEGRLNAWPMDEAYVDSTTANPKSGMINNPAFVINAATLSAQNERGGEENIATGWHAIEFLLWGQDLRTDGPGARAYTDFVDGQAPNADRRRTYLKTVTDLLVQDLDALVQAWAPQTPGNYRARFEAGQQESLRKIFVGLGSLSRGELAGERLEVALASQDQEDEHSCFSDNTHRDVVNNALGIENVWLGRYQRADGSLLQGASLQALVQAKNPALADKTTRQLAASVTAAKAIQAPFDREIIGARDAPGRQRIQATINSLTAQSHDLVAAARAIGIQQLTLVRP